MADLIQAKLIGSAELRRRLRKMNPKQNARIVRPALLESGLLVTRIAARDKILPGGSGPPKPSILTSRTGTLRRSLTSNFAVQLNAQLQFVDAGTHLLYGAVHENSRRAFLKPAFRDASRNFDDIFRKHWARAGEVT